MGSYHRRLTLNSLLLMGESTVFNYRYVHGTKQVDRMMYSHEFVKQKQLPGVAL